MKQERKEEILNRSTYVSMTLGLMGTLWLLNPNPDVLIPTAGIIFGSIGVKRTKSKWAYVGIVWCSVLLAISVVRIILIILYLHNK